MAKIYIEDIKLTAIRNKIFASLSQYEQINIFDAVVLSSGDYLPTQKMIEGDYSVYGGGGTTDKNHNDFNIEFETLGIGRVGARCGCVFKIKPKSWITDNALYASKLDKRFDLEFLIHFLNFKNLNQYANTAAQPVISLKRISGISIPKIDLKLQKEIALILNNVEQGLIEIEKDRFGIRETLNYISSSESLTNELTYQLSLVKNLRQQLLQDAVQGKLVKNAVYTEGGKETAHDLLKKIKAEKEQLIKDKKLKKEKELPPIKAEEIPFVIPDDWVWCRLGEIAYITSGSTPSQDSFVETGIPYLKMYNLRNQKIDFFYKPQYIKEEVHNGQLKRCRAYPGDVLMNIVGPPLGKIAIIPDDLPECNFNQAAVLIRPLFKEMNHFIFWYLNEMSEINSIDTKGVAGQNNISVTQAHNMKIVLPPLSIQHRIVAKIESLMQLCAAIETSIAGSVRENEQLLQQVLREALQGS